jgi:predicted 2-oxoglutarate/Fe(II)-dependent dioxygenase YbiX
MPRASFFRDLGLFVAPGFLAPALCDELRAQLSQVRAQATTIAGEQASGGGVVDEAVRKAARVCLEGPAKVNLKQRFMDLMPALQDHFKTPLSGCQGPEFLRYDPGAFYLAHRDKSENGPVQTARRRVSAVLFLNTQTKEPVPDMYGGGSLAFYGLLDGAQWEKVGIPLEGEAGLLVAFDSGVFHEVQPITFVRRYTAVSWFTS